MTREEIYDAVLNGESVENFSVKELRSVVQDFDMDFQMSDIETDFELVWCPIWLELDVREHRKKKTQDDVNRLHEQMKKRRKKIKTSPGKLDF